MSSRLRAEERLEVQAASRFSRLADLRLLKPEDSRRFVLRDFAGAAEWPASEFAVLLGDLLDLLEQREESVGVLHMILFAMSNGYAV